MTPTERALWIGYQIGKGQRLDPSQIGERLQLDNRSSPYKIMYKTLRVLPVVRLLDGSYMDMDQAAPHEIDLGWFDA